LVCHRRCIKILATKGSSMFGFHMTSCSWMRN